MKLALIDWVLIVAYFVFSIAIAFMYTKRAGKSLGEFFLGGRSLPWYLAGISMVATTFAADTPLAVTELVVQKGISGNWLWWNMCIGGMLTTFFFARLWRRADVLTEVEFITLRYTGAPARLLRNFKAVYLGFLMNVLVMGWVNLAMLSLLKLFFGLSDEEAFWYTAAAMAIVAAYSSLGGFMSVAVTDAFQFILAMTGCIVLAILVLNSEQIGGIDGLVEKLGPENSVWNMLPQIGSGSEAAQTFSITFASFFAYIGLQWWASWYPGAEPGGGGYVAQRMMSVRTERDSVLATLFFQVAHYCLRPWPWIIVALCAIVLYPDLPDSQVRLGYVYAMRDFLPIGWRGMMLVAFFAAYMSTIATQLNWGASYIVNDLYVPLRSGGAKGSASDDKHLITVSRVVTMALMVVALAVTSKITSISAVWEFMIECGAGLGMVLILRWFWWRINVWSEISATVAPFFFYAASKYLLPSVVPAELATENWVIALSTFPGSYFITIGGTTLVWLLVTFVTKPEPLEHLAAYHRRVRPGGWWAPVEGLSGVKVYANTVPLIMAWISSVTMTYATLFATGKLIFKDYFQGLIYLGVALVSGLFLWLVVREWNLFGDEEKIR